MSDLQNANCKSLDNLLVGGASPLAAERFNEILKQVSETVAPVWPLKDYVAVNPYFGIRQRTFVDVRAFFKVFSDCEMLMPVDYYAEQYRQSNFDQQDIETALSELSEVGLNCRLQISEVIARLQAGSTRSSTLDQPAPEANPERRVRTMAEVATQLTNVHWAEAVCDELSNYCARHYDDGQASWQSPLKHLSLFQAWRTQATRDHSMESLGMIGFREYVKHMPCTAEAAIAYSLNRMKLPLPLWSTFLLCQAFSIPGWSAWTKYQDAEANEASGNDFAGLLAMRLAYDAVLSETLGIECNWDEFIRDDAACFPMPLSGNDTALRYTLLRASEIGFRKSLLQSLNTAPTVPQPTSRKLAQMVFCIDVRSERMRRQVESISRDIETFGFAGFFAVPMAYTPMSEAQSINQLPVLLKPQFKVAEGVQSTSGLGASEAAGIAAGILSSRLDARSWRKLWRGFQASAVGCFSFVETTGLFFGYKLLRRVLGLSASTNPRRDGVKNGRREDLGPTLWGLEEQGVTPERQIALAEGLLTNLGLRQNFSRLVVFCGHGSQTENNPLAAGLDCGACGGHPGEPNARFAALLLNQPTVRSALAERGIIIPSDTQFIAAVHNTTTDKIEFCDLQQLPETHRGDLQELNNLVHLASKQTREERLPIVASKTLSDLVRRAVDWSEIRPEWGLAGNAAFIVAPRSMTKGANLNARSFLHSYEHALDPDGKVLELIMTAPMVVANWINMQYYASTVDNHHFGSGNKTVHNVVGQFGILSGNGGDLKTGLPWQSLHTGRDYQHLPMRLQVVIAASQTSVGKVIDKHEMVADLITNGWLHLLVIESNGQLFRYTALGAWELI